MKGASDSDDQGAPTCLAVVIGATGGIGRALVAELSARSAAIVGLSRSSDPPIDLLDESSISHAAQIIGGMGIPLRLVIDATGILHQAGLKPEKSWRELDPGQLAASFAVNAIGPALLIKHFLPLFPRSGRAVFASLSARVGSIGDNRLGGWYGYRASKAALNQLVRTAAVELARTRPEAICVALHPGTVDTDLSKPFAKSGLSAQMPAEAARNLLATIERLATKDSGAFFGPDGQSIAW